MKTIVQEMRITNNKNKPGKNISKYKQKKQKQTQQFYFNLMKLNLIQLPLIILAFVAKVA